MNNIVRMLGVSLASMVGILLISGVAWAQATETPIAGRWISCQNLEEPEKLWVDEDGIEHGRNSLYSCRHFGSLKGLERDGQAGNEIRESGSRNAGITPSRVRS